MNNELFGGIEAGGTKFCLAIGDADGKIIEESVIPTRHPDETLPEVIDFFKSVNGKSRLSAIGIASFGPVDPDPESKHFGYTTTTPKPGWHMFDFAGAVKRAIRIPVGFDTDVNGAALGEHRWGAARGLETFIYVTVGTGIGGGGMIGGKLMHGLTHPEMGHILIPHDWGRDPFKGVCPYHGGCLEGLASGPSIQDGASKGRPTYQPAIQAGKSRLIIWQPHLPVIH
jgi:fructokinase